MSARPGANQLDDTQASSVKSFGLAVAFWITSCAVTPLLVLSAAREHIAAGQAVAVSAIVVYSGTRLAIIIAEGQLRIFTGLFWLFVYVALGVAPLAQLSTGRTGTVLRDTGQLVPASFLILFGLLAHDFGQFLARGRTHEQSRWVRASSRVATVSRPRLVWLTLFAVAASLWYANRLGGPSVFFTSREGLGESLVTSGLRTGDSLSTTAVVIAVGTVPILVALICWTAVVAQQRTRAGLVALVMWAITLAINLIVNNPITSSRYWFLTVLLSLLFVLPGLSPNRFRTMLIVGIVAAVFLFPLADRFRYHKTARPIEGQSILDTLSVKDYDQLVMTANGLWWIGQRGGFSYGRQFLGDLLFWFPRSAWPDKPIDTGIEIGRAMQVRQTNLSSPLWIEAWVDFGIVGTGFVLMLWGYGGRRADDAFVARRRLGRDAELTRVGLLLPLLAGYELILLRGPFLQATGRLVAMVAVVSVVTRVVDRPAEASTHVAPARSNSVAA